MPDATDALNLTVHASLAEVTPQEWDACAGPDNPFISHAFLTLLEESGSVGAETGWQPQHLGIRDASGRLLACAPLYLKSHSFGEYVFDWGWAQAYERAGGRYYPKLQCSVPFTPVTGPRLMVRPGENTEALQRMLAAGMIEIANRYDASSVHITFPTEREFEALGELGMLRRLGQQYHWENRNYESFDDFLAALSSRKRKTIRKERERANDQGVKFRTLVGDDITPRHGSAFYAFYLATVDRKWASAYLTRDFFMNLGKRMGDRVVLVVGEYDGDPVCAALNLRGRDTLYGRNWGAHGDWRFLHFEACYYRAIDFAIEHGLKWVEAGAQGQHKVQRGYLPRPTYSAHWIADPRLREPVARFLEQERHALNEDMEYLREAGPYRKTDTGGETQ